MVVLNDDNAVEVEEFGEGSLGQGLARALYLLRPYAKLDIILFSSHTS